MRGGGGGRDEAGERRRRRVVWRYEWSGARARPQTGGDPTRSRAAAACGSGQRVRGTDETPSESAVVGWGCYTLRRPGGRRAEPSGEESHQANIAGSHDPAPKPHREGRAAGSGSLERTLPLAVRAVRAAAAAHTTRGPVPAGSGPGQSAIPHQRRGPGRAVARGKRNRGPPASHGHGSSQRPARLHRTSAPRVADTVRVFMGLSAPGCRAGPASPAPAGPAGCAAWMSRLGRRRAEAVGWQSAA